MLRMIHLFLMMLIAAAIGLRAAIAATLFSLPMLCLMLAFAALPLLSSQIAMLPAMPLTVAVTVCRFTAYCCYHNVCHDDATPIHRGCRHEWLPSPLPYAIFAARCR